MKRGAMTHGSKSHREHGSTGPGTTPGRNFPGLHMAGQMGNVRRKVRSLQVLKVDLERRAIVVQGSVPGKAGNLLEIAPAKVRRVEGAGCGGGECRKSWWGGSCACRRRLAGWLSRSQAPGLSLTLPCAAVPVICRTGCGHQLLSTNGWGRAVQPRSSCGVGGWQQLAVWL
jgi:hypothetical protein